VAALVCAAAGAVALGGAPAPDHAAGSPARPNVIVVMVDDISLAEQPYLDEINSRIGARGARFNNSFSSFPLCCPSRATFLTGQYAQNHRVRGNAIPEGGYPKLNHSNTLPVWLQEDGYYTALIGKYLNMYEQQPQPETIPPGWDHWAGTSKTYFFYDWQINDNGSLVNYGLDAADYQTDVFTDRATALIDEVAPAKQPFFLWLSYLAPHDGGPNPSPQPPDDCDGSAKPPPRYANAHNSIQPPRTPSFGERNISDKPSWLRGRPRFDEEDQAFIDRLFRCRVESLLAVDEGVGEVLDAVGDAGELDNTYVIYTSDNGFVLGQHRLRQGKNFVYEQSIRVPLMIRGPGIPAHTRVRDLAVNADVPATILKLTGAQPGRLIDGRSLLPLIRRPSIRRGRELLIQVRFKNHTLDRNAVGVRNHRYLYAQFDNGERELYDLKRDPDELTNLVGDPDYRRVERLLNHRLLPLSKCKGNACNRAPETDLEVKGPPPSSRRCAREPAQAVVGGEDRARTVRFEYGPASTIDRAAPFKLELDPRLRDRARDVRAHVELMDGRLIDLARSVSACTRGG
jgi:arylsulfatase A-like enzyme